MKPNVESPLGVFLGRAAEFVAKLKPAIGFEVKFATEEWDSWARYFVWLGDGEPNDMRLCRAGLRASAWLPARWPEWFNQVEADKAALVPVMIPRKDDVTPETQERMKGRWAQLMSDIARGNTVLTIAEQNAYDGVMAKRGKSKPRVGMTWAQAQVHFAKRRGFVA